MSSHLTNEILQKQSWDYFKLHSQQRLTTFNFYLVISSVIISALFATFNKDYKIPYLGIAMGLLLSFFSFVFWKIDIRNRQLINTAITALIFFESTSELKDHVDEPHIGKVFMREEYETNIKRTSRSMLPWKTHYGYSTSFNMVFVTFGLAGVIGAVVALIRTW
jgi:hypothetical protein